jgi:hypothetical protein
MRKAMAAAALSATLVTGTAIGATVFAPNIVGAQSDGTTTTTTPTPTPAKPAPDGQTREEHLRATLQPLVDNGTITEAQRDAVVAALEAAGPGEHGFRAGPFGFGASDAIASLLGVDAETLHSELASGKTLADIAGEKGVDVQEVVDAIVAEQTSRIDAAVADGRLTQEQADARKADLAQHATDLVNGVRPEPPAGFEWRGHMHGPGMWGGGGAGSGSSSSATSA